MPQDTYKWVKTYAINTSDEDEVAVGDEIRVNHSGGSSRQVVLSVTPRLNKDGKPYKTLIVRELTEEAADVA